MTLLIAGLHTMGVLRKPETPEEISITDAMKAFTFRATGMEWSIQDVMMSIALTMSVLMVFIVAANFLILYAVSSPVLRRRWILLDAIVMWVLAGLYGLYQIPPPFFSFVLLGVFFTITYVQQSGSEPSA